MPSSPDDCRCNAYTTICFVRERRYDNTEKAQDLTYLCRFQPLSTKALDKGSREPAAQTPNRLWRSLLASPVAVKGHLHFGAFPFERARKDRVDGTTCS